MKQNGNALFIILIAVALFAALSYAITQSGRGGGNIDREENLIRGAQLVQYASQIETTMNKIILLNGIAPEDFSFDAPNWGFTDYQHGTPQPDTNKVFHPDGGDVAWQDFSQLGILKFTGVNSVIDVGECGDNSSAACKELMLLVILNDPAACAEINQSIFGDSTIIADNFSTGTTATDNAFAGTFGPGTTDNFAINEPGLVGQRTACVEDSGPRYVFYHVLTAR